MKILVIGGAGYIGSHVVYELCDNGYEVTVLDNLSTGFLKNIDSRANFVEDSLINITETFLSEFDCVIHLAALKAAGESMQNPIRYSKDNITNSIELINKCVTAKIEKFIFSSTAAVYGFPDYLPIDENHSLNPVNYYGFTKLVIENHLNWISKIHGLKIAFLRYFNAAGYDINNRVMCKEINPQNLLPIVMEVASGQRKSMDVFGNDYNTNDGTCLRDYIHVNDLASGHVKAIEYLSNSDKIITNLATGNYHSVLDVINCVEKITQTNIKYDIVERREGDPDTLYASSNNLLNLECKHSDLATIVKTMWNVYKS